MNDEYVDTHSMSKDCETTKVHCQKSHDVARTMKGLTDTHSMSTDFETTKMYIIKSHMMWHER